MKKNLLIASVLVASSVCYASAPAGDIYLLGLNGVSIPSEENRFILGERDEDDIEEGLWRWTIPAVEITVESGNVTVSDNDGLSLGFDSDNDFGFTNEISKTQSMIYLAQGGEGVNYNLSTGTYNVNLLLFEDLDGDMGGDSWMLQILSSGGGDTEDDNYYLIGFNGTEEPSATARFVRNVIEEDDEIIITYTIPRYYVSECPAGFSVFDASGDVFLGLNPEFASMAPEVTDESPMVFLGEGGEKVKCSLTPGYYDVNFSSTGAIAMISFNMCEDQTPEDELEYCLIGINGVSDIASAPRFIRIVDSVDYENDEPDQNESEEIITYSMTGLELESCDNLFVVSTDGTLKFGFNSDSEIFASNNITLEMPFAMLAANGPAVNCSLPSGNYGVTFTITGPGTAMLSFADSSAVEMISDNDNASTEYYNMQGMRISEPQKGIFIKKTGSKVVKILR